MRSIDNVPARVRRQLERDEPVTAIVKVRRRGGTSASTSKGARVGVGAASGVAAATVVKPGKTPKGSSMPKHAYLALTDRRLIVVSTSVFAFDRDLGRPLTLNRVKNARMRAPEKGSVGARLGLASGYDLDVEVSQSHAEQLESFVAAVQQVILDFATARSRRPANWQPQG